MDNGINHEIRNALTSMAGILKERLKLTTEYDKRMAKLSRDYLTEMARVKEAQKCISKSLL